jgi:sugar phosphate isomerase/epimerase
MGGCTYPWLWKSSLKEALEHLKRLELQYLELMLMPPHIPDEWIWKKDRTELQELKSYLQQNDLHVTAVNPMFFGINLASFNPRYRAESLRYFQAAIKIAGLLEAPYVTIGLGFRHALAPEPMENVWKRAKGAVLESLALCEKYNVTLGIENLVGNFMNTSDACLQMINEIGSDYAKITYDPANSIIAGEDLKEGISNVKDHLVNFHVSDSKPTQWRHAPVGEGVIDFGKVAQTLQEIDYQGVTILEIADCKDPFVDYGQSIEKLESLGWSRN